MGFNSGFKGLISSIICEAEQVEMSYALRICDWTRKCSWSCDSLHMRSSVAAAVGLQPCVSR